MFSGVPSPGTGLPPFPVYYVVPRSPTSATTLSSSFDVFPFVADLNAELLVASPHVPLPPSLFLFFFQLVMYGAEVTCFLLLCCWLDSFAGSRLFCPSISSRVREAAQFPFPSPRHLCRSSSPPI